MNVPREFRYTKTHEWVRVDGDEVIVGITDFAQQQLSDLTYVELPSAGDQVAAEDEVGVVESVKAASDIYAPMDGEIVAVNESLNDKPELVNTEPFEGGWVFRLKPNNPGDVEELLDADQYEELLPDDA